MDDGPVRNNEPGHRFEVRFPDGDAFLKYHYDREGRLSLDHVEVPAAHEHHGLAGRLTKAALDFARERRLTIVPACPFVIEYLRNHPEAL